VCHSSHHCVSKATGLTERPGECVLLINSVISSGSCPSMAFETIDNMNYAYIFPNAFNPGLYFPCSDSNGWSEINQLGQYCHHTHSYNLPWHRRRLLFWLRLTLSPRVRERKVALGKQRQDDPRWNKMPSLIVCLFHPLLTSLHFRPKRITTQGNLTAFDGRYWEILPVSIFWPLSSKTKIPSQTIALLGN
jgi:hypothetical protein